MKALAWDDLPKDYMQPLAETFLEYEINLTVTDDEHEFMEKYRKDGPWQFLVLDLLKMNEVRGKDPEDDYGLQLAAKVRDVDEKIPIFILTLYPQLVKKPLFSMAQNIVLKSKDVSREWMAFEIVRELRTFGVFVDTQRVFLIFGRDRNAIGTRGKVAKYLENTLGLKVEQIMAENLFNEINRGLLQKMNNCAAFVAVCTPDDQISSTPDGDVEMYQPRQNVLFEMGVAIGLRRGLERLTILQRWGEEPKDKAILPSDFGGVVPIRFYDDVNLIFDKLKEHIRNSGVQI